MLQSLLLSALLPTSILASPLIARTYTDDCGAGTFTVSGRTCNIYCNLDYAGGDYKSAPAATLQDCLSLCAADSLCTDAQFNRNNKYCYMKNKITRTSWSSNTDSVVCDVTPDSDGPSDGGPAPSTPSSTPSCPAEKVVNGRTCTATCAYDRAGYDYDQQYTGTAALCMDACMRDTKCVTAQFNKGNGFCYLKNHAQQGTVSTTTDTIDCSGPKMDCSAASKSGLTYNLFSHTISGYGETINDFKADLIKGKTSQATGTWATSLASYAGANWPVLNTNSEMTALVLQGIFIAPSAGKYTITSDNYYVDNWAYIWTGEKAYSEWCEGNQDYGLAGPTQYTPYTDHKVGTTSFTLAAGEGIPVTILIANGGGPGKADFTLTLPDGSQTTDFVSNFAPTCAHAKSFST